MTKLLTALVIILGTAAMAQQNTATQAATAYQELQRAAADRQEQERNENDTSKKGTFDKGKSFTVKGILKNPGGGVTIVREGRPDADLDVREETLVTMGTGPANASEPRAQEVGSASLAEQAGGAALLKEFLAKLTAEQGIAVDDLTSDEDSVSVGQGIGSKVLRTTLADTRYLSWVVTCTARPDAVHRSVKLGGAIFKVRITCTSTGTGAPEFVQVTLSGGIYFNGTLRESVTESSLVNTKGRKVTRYIPSEPGRTAGRGTGWWELQLTAQITSPIYGPKGFFMERKYLSIE